jgi:hypothetical protein
VVLASVLAACTNTPQSTTNLQSPDSPQALPNTPSQTSARVPGESYLLCPAYNSNGTERYTAASTKYLTSPYTYDSLASGIESYTIAQYQALLKGGASLPPLPSYVAAEPQGTLAAIIYAPGSTVTVPSYNTSPPTAPNSPIIQFFEGGAYTDLSLQSVSGDEFIGGSAPGYPEPRFNDKGTTGGIQQTNDSLNYSGAANALAATAPKGATTISVAGTLPNYIQYVTFADGFADKINKAGTGSPPVSVTLDTPLPRAEARGGTVWVTSNPPIATVSAAAPQGAGSLTLTTSTPTWPTPILPFGTYVLGDDTYQIQSVTGSEAASYTIRLPSGGLDAAVAAGTPVFYNGEAGDVTVSYLDISDDLHSDNGIITTGAGWTVTHNNIHDSVGTTGSGNGNGISGGDKSVIEYNCLSRLGNSAMAGYGINGKWDYNEVYQSSYSNDPDCGCSSAGKWWGTLNTDIVDNAFIDGGYGGSGAVWLDNGNAGTNISGNYFYKTFSQAIGDETGFNLNVTDNLFVDGGWGTGNGCGDSNCVGSIDLNQSGGFPIVGSRYNNEVIISGNQFIDNWGGVDIWESGLRTCESSGEGWPGDAPYCSGGFPVSQLTGTTVAGGQYDFSHTTDSGRGGMLVLAQPANAGSVTLMVHGAADQQTASAEAINDQIGFADPAVTTVASGVSSISITGCTAARTCTIPVKSAAGFPAGGGELRVGTTAAGQDGGGGFTGAILRYTGIGTTTVNSNSSPALTGATFIRGVGSLQSGFSVQQVQPYQVTGETCYANDCKVSISPPLTMSVAAETNIAGTGTCALFATAAATPTSPIAPGGTSYFNGCQWAVKNISVTGNTFTFDPSAIAAGTTATGKAGTTCTADHADECGTNFMAFQATGQEPWADSTSANAMFSRSALTDCPSWDSDCTASPLTNINALSSAPNAPARNGEAAWNDVWSDNTYTGPWAWNAYAYGSCDSLPSDPTTGKSMPSGACRDIDFATWKGDWQEDLNSSHSATPQT